MNSGLCRRLMPFVAEIPVQLEHLWETADQQSLQIQLGGDAQEKIDAERVVVRLERPRRRAAGDRLHHRRLDFEKAAGVKKIADAAQDLAAGQKDRARFFVGNQVEIALAVAGFDVREAVPFVRQRAQRLAEHLKLAHPQRRLTGLGQKSLAFDPDEVADVEQGKHLGLLGGERFFVKINLDPAGQVAEVEKVRLAEIAVRGDATRGALDAGFRERSAHFLDRPFHGKATSKRIEPASAKRVELAAAVGQQFVVGWVHEETAAAGGRPGRAGNVRRPRRLCQRRHDGAKERRGQWQPVCSSPPGRQTKTAAACGSRDGSLAGSARPGAPVR